TDGEILLKYATEYAQLRAHKGVTLEQALAKMADLSYFGTMMVHFAQADGMVSGACHTTANTIRPALEFIKTKPGISVVSGAFLMCLNDQVAVFGDCAVNLNPSAQQLADIAIATSETAVGFGIVPKVAMLSYSTASSGSGPDVDRVREATRIAQAAAPGLALDGPLQFDAAVSRDVAALKLPDSLVAGQASVFIFPDLEAGNIGYKAVQRTSGALAIGPLLQGLRKPVNDLSRGALVDDIVNTIIITAIQAQTS
ncbi:MAG: phosphate acetyltransferase, partial [Propionibacteriaceae bacterium]|nr:phosphate acetyltransferase [Propionibacteriaceae bacterium]